MSTRLTILGLLAAAALATPAARAADLDDYGYASDVDAPSQMPVAQLPQTKVEFGSGWYVRGDIGGAFFPQVESQPSAYSNTPVLATDGDRQVRFTGSLGGGYSFNRWFRADITGDYNQPIETTQYGSSVCPPAYGLGSGSCGTITNGFVHSYDVLVNGYVDLGRWSIITPYIGAGAGLGFGHFSNSASYSPYAISGAATVAYGRTFYNFAYALMAGASFDVYSHTKLDIGYRFVDLGRVQDVHLNAQEVRAGLRYMIDN